MKNMFDSASLLRKDQKRLARENISKKLPSGLAKYLANIQAREENDRTIRFIKNYLITISPHLEGVIEWSDKGIQYGIFKDILFGNPENLQAGIVQKLLGVYEIELKPWISEFSKNQYDYVMNIGAAEGLYSILFEKLFPATSIYSFEQEFWTRNLLRKTCLLNNTENVVVLGEFDTSAIENIDEKKRGLIFCDCEGFESVIFSPAYLEKFRNCDLIIEVHDHIIPDVSSTLQRNLAHREETFLIEQITLQDRLKLISNQSFKSLPEDTKISLINEDRPPSNMWIVSRGSKP
jgi:hypothetical protein